MSFCLFSITKHCYGEELFFLLVPDQQIRAIELKNKKNTVNPVAISSLESNQPIQKVWQWLALKRNTEDQLYAIKLYISHRCKGNKQIKIWTILL